MNHASVVPGIGDRLTSVTSGSSVVGGSSVVKGSSVVNETVKAPEIFSNLDVLENVFENVLENIADSSVENYSTVEHIQKKLAKDPHGSHQYTRQAVQPSGSYLRSNSDPGADGSGVHQSFIQTLKEQPVQKGMSMIEHESLDVAESTVAESDADESGDVLVTAEADEEAEDTSAYESSLDRLRRSSLALNQFADGLRKQYALDDVKKKDEKAAVSFDAAQVVDAFVPESVAIPAELKAEPKAESKPQLHENVPARYRQYKQYRKMADEGPFRGKGLFESASRFFLQTVKQPDVFVHHYSNFAKELFTILQARSDIEPERSDKRFRDAVWKDNFAYRSVMQAYLAWDKEVSGWVEDLDMDDADRSRSRFLYEQMSAMLSPTNSPLNPVAVKRAYQTGGKSVVMGLKNMADDIRNNHGMPSQVRADSYEIGKDLGCSEGAVVYRSEVLELIQYKMDDDQVVSERPVLIVPPQLNKFYIFDLTPKNSVVRYLKDKGVQPFIISWRNPSKHNAEWNLDRYVSEMEAALEVMCEITGCDQVNLASACAGGLTSMALLGYLKAANKPLVHSHSLFVTALQADESFQLGLFASRQTVELSRKHAQMNGFMDGKALSHIFSWLRPTDLVWNFWINNYLLGKEPPMLDVLFWDNDSTRLPAGLHSDFLDIFIKDAFVSPNTLTVKGYPIDIKKITMDFYCVGGDEDYLMPWKKCFEVPELVDSKCTFVLSTSGHIQSILRPPGIANTAYYTNDQSTLSVENADEWLKTATKNSGSWWEHWQAWLQDHSGKQRFAPQRLGSDKNPTLSAAPGLYVNEKVA